MLIIIIIVVVVYIKFKIFSPSFSDAVLQVLGAIKDIYFKDSSFDSSDYELHVSILTSPIFYLVPCLI